MPRKHPSYKERHATETPEKRRKRLQAQKLRMRQRYAAETAAHRRERLRREAAAARARTARTNKKKPAHRSAREEDALQNGLTIVANRLEFDRPKFVVITPQGRRIETLEPDLA